MMSVGNAAVSDRARFTGQAGLPRFNLRLIAGLDAGGAAAVDIGLQPISQGNASDRTQTITIIAVPVFAGASNAGRHLAAILGERVPPRIIVAEIFAGLATGITAGKIKAHGLSSWLIVGWR